MIGWLILAAVLALCAVLCIRVRWNESAAVKQAIL